MDISKITVSGKVQGVGYRSYVKQLADKHQVSGTVRNLSNGDVMIIAQGSVDNIRSFVKAIQVPQHRMMKVANVDVEDTKIDKSYDSFSIIY